MSICFIHCDFVLLPIVIIDYALDVLSREFATAAGRPEDIIPPPMPPLMSIPKTSVSQTAK
ncbi:hypothetical protein [Paraburkholderia sp. RL17-337-BIB-A]|uniref:hypothetical protein n=1 Tax=Paraburkholderia sp. RL17-337-BIB-A TaxID=3031636 RepID=UPI0038BCFDC0